MTAWRTAMLGEVATITRTTVNPSDVDDDTAYVGLENIERGGTIINVASVGNSDITSTKFRFTNKQILFGKLRPYLAKVARPEFGGICSTDILPISPSSRLNRDYLAHFLARPEIVTLAASKATGANLPRLSPSELAKFQIPLPPLEEQQRIAEVLDRVDELRTKRRKALANLDGLTRAIYYRTFCDSADTTGSWLVRTVGELCEVKGGKRLPNGAEYSKTPTDFRYIRVTDFRDGAISESELVFLSPGIQRQISRYIVRVDDIVISIAGSIGLIAQVPRSLDGANLTENAARLTPRQKGVYDSTFLTHLLQSDSMQEQIAGHIGQATIGKLALFRIEKLWFHFPPLELQQAFATKVRVVEELKAVQRRHLAELDGLFASLQDRAFKGLL